MVVLSMGRRWGKTVLGEVLCVTFAARSAKVAWVVPSYKNGRPLWRMVRRTLAPLKSAGLVRINETDRIVEFADAIGGGFLGMYTGEDNCDAMRGDDFDLVVVDEASKLKEEAFTDAILPTLADRNGKVMLISTPRGRGWFWRWWVLGQDATQTDVVSYTAPSSDNPNPRIKRAARLAKERMPDKTYRQEWLAEFVEDGGGVFTGVRALIDPNLAIVEQPPKRSIRYSMGVDLAKDQDYTAVVVLDLDSKTVANLYRWNHESWSIIKAKIAYVASIYNDPIVWIDASGGVNSLPDDLSRAGLRIMPFKYTESSRAALFEHGVLCVEQRLFRLPSSERVNVLVAEMEAMEWRQSGSLGRYRPDHPSGQHDDTVHALLLALWGSATSGSLPSGVFETIVGDLPTGVVTFDSLSQHDLRPGLGRRL